ncbi:hypothetical protein HYQ45_018812 [Verticillium longisporum]|uniref:Uncharacterized protein n=1 Tax=Verticillium longisporum TaxID=100787 RepID=A0A8I2ZZM7_VERLO|nr:hypothetical protein HYQ45_018812 [Verticillium longisporum]
MFTNLWLLGGLGVLALTVYLYQALVYRRLRQFAHLPQIKPSVVWGHLAVLGEHFKSDGSGTTDMEGQDTATKTHGGEYPFKTYVGH